MKFRFGKKDTKQNRLSRIERAKGFLLDDKPFTKALILRGSHYQDEAYEDLKSMTGRVAYKDDDKTLEEFIESCANTVAANITRDAAKKIGRKADFLPTEPLPEDAPFTVAFSLCVLHGLADYLSGDGIEIDLRESMLDTANNFFMFHPDEERAKHALDAIKVFQEIAKSSLDNVIQWRESLTKLISIFILQWTSKNRQFQEIECVSLFGTMMSGLYLSPEQKKGYLRVC